MHDGRHRGRVLLPREAPHEPHRPRWSARTQHDVMLHPAKKLYDVEQAGNVARDGPIERLARDVATRRP